MPRKQRFKPSRKPQSNQATVSSPQVDERKEIYPHDDDVEREAPAREGMQDIEQNKT